MSRVRAGGVLGGSVAQAERLWFDLRRWPSFVDGFAAVAKADASWPAEGARVLWDSQRGGRGRVSELASWRGEGEGQDAEIEDERIIATQRVRFADAGAGAVRIDVELDYSYKHSRALMVVVDLLFVRRAMRDSLRRTLVRYARELESEPRY